MNNANIVEYNPNNEPITKAVIWLHGLGADGNDFVPIVSELGLAGAVRFIFPHADHMPITINGGYVMSAWYDILAMDDLSRTVDMVHIDKSAKRIMAIIDEQIRQGISAQDIVVAGFSQGGAIAYHVAMTCEHQLGGLLALSTYFASMAHITDWRADSDLPIFICHGDNDPIVSPYLGQQAKGALIERGYQPVYQSYPMAHQVCMEQIADIGRWLNGVLDLS